MGSGKFITNAEKTLSDSINAVLPTTKNVYFLVGYFYFSGFQTLYKDLKDKNLKVLVGMDIELGIQNSVREIFQLNTELQYRNTNTSDNFIQHLKELINKSELFDTKVNQEALEIFIEKIQNGTLEIRKTLEPNHSKLYLFENSDEHNEKGDYPGIIITGSSNLTYSGLTGRDEFNCIFREKDEFIAAKEIFDRLWNTAVSITSGGENDPVVKMMKEETRLKVPSPYYCYMRLLFDRFENQKEIKTPNEITEGNFQNLEYQIDAIKEGLKIIEQHHGVIVADVVGLGKSIIGSTLLYNLQQNENKKAIIICPPHLQDQWKEYSDLFQISVEIFSSGKIKQALEQYNKHRKLYGYILIDEAHKYVNSDTIDYGYLHQMCQGNKVILLTATPFNNKPDDIFNLLKFFQIPEKSTLNMGGNLMQEFRRLQNDYKEIVKLQKNKEISDDEVKFKANELSKKIRNLIGCVVIRRSRLDLKHITSYQRDLKKQGYEFSKVKDPQTKEYDLGTLKPLYIQTLENLIETDENGKWMNFRGARYNVLGYLNEDVVEKYQKNFEDTFGCNYSLITGRQSNMPDFIRRLLVSRFESSVDAFKITLKSLLGSIEMIQKYLEKFDCIPVIRKGSLPDIDKFDDYDDFGEFEESQSLFFELNDFNEAKIENQAKIKEKFVAFIEKKDGFIISKEDIKPEFFSDLEKDGVFLKKLIEDWNMIQDDPKMDAFAGELKAQLQEDPQRKIVVFSQYADTIKVLYKTLEKEGVKVLTVTGKQKTQELKKDIKYNFDAGVPEEFQRDDFDVLLGTDAISEGYNLHRAGTIYNYDIPYNPTKVIQRIGRINRVNKKVFEELYIFNYFPSLIGENVTRIKEISVLKMRMINAILGNDTKILTGDEVLNTFKENSAGDISDVYKETLKKEEEETQEELSWESQYRNELKEAMQEDPDLKKKIYAIPERSRLKRTIKTDASGVLLFAKKGANLFFSFYDKKTNEVSPLGLEEGFALFKADKGEQQQKVSESFYEYYDKIKEHLKNTPHEVAKNLQEKKAIDNLKMLYAETKDHFFMDLIKAINLGNLPSCYMSEIRSITENNRKEIVKNLKNLISQEYLDTMIQVSQDFDEQLAELIISEEF